MSSEIHIVIADDHPIVRRGLRQTIEGDLQLKVLAEADDGEEAIRLIEELGPEIAVLDVDMPKLDGFEVAREVRTRGLATRIVFLTIHSEEDLFQAAMDLGVSGYILKDSAIFELVAGIKAVAEGKYFVTPSLTEFLIRRRPLTAETTAEEPLAKLTPSERRVTKLIAEYKSNKEIADELFIHYRTVENHRANICQKLELRGRNALLKFALEHKARL